MTLDVVAWKCYDRDRFGAFDVHLGVSPLEKLGGDETLRAQNCKNANLTLFK